MYTLTGFAVCVLFVYKRIIYFIYLLAPYLEENNIFSTRQYTRIFIIVQS